MAVSSHNASYSTQKGESKVAKREFKECRVWRTFEPHQIDAPIIRIEIDLENGTIGTLLGFLENFDSDYPSKIRFRLLDENPKIRLARSKEKNRGYLSAIIEGEEQVICWLTQEGESDRSWLILSNSINAASERFAGERFDEIMGKPLVICGKRISYCLDTFKVDGWSRSSSLLWVAPNGAQKLVEFRDRAIAKRATGLYARAQDRLKKELTDNSYGC